VTANRGEGNPFLHQLYRSRSYPNEEGEPELGGTHARKKELISHRGTAG